MNQVVLALTLLLLIPGAITAQPVPQLPGLKDPNLTLRGERYAILIGVHKYDKSSGLRPLAFTNNDVLKFAELLKQTGYRSENIVVMTEDADVARLLPERAKILAEIQSVLRDRTKEDTVIIGLAGHGVQFASDRDSYFCPLDTKLDDKSTLLSLGDLYSQFEKCNAGFKLVFCDACRNDPFPPTTRGLSLILEGERAPDRKPPSGIASFYSCSKGEAAYEDSDLRHGVFFHFVIRGLLGDGDLDHDKMVTLPELEYFVKRRVADYVRSEFSGQRQMPNLVGNTSGLVSISVLPDEKVEIRTPLGAVPKKTASPNELPEENSPIQVSYTNSLGMPFVAILPGEFLMGNDVIYPADAQPAHRVRITKPFYIGVYEVTQRDYAEVMGSNPSFFQRGGDGDKVLQNAENNSEDYCRIIRRNTAFHPVERVTWSDCVEFCRRLSKREGRVYRLPTEAEWEFACRAGSAEKYFWGDNLGKSKEYCFGSSTSGPVGRLTPNAFGLYDTCGNVREFCADNYSDRYFAISSSVDPKGPMEPSRLKVLKGGNFAQSFSVESWQRGSAPDNRAASNAGFRIVLDLTDEELTRFQRDDVLIKELIARIPNLQAIRRADDRSELALKDLNAGEKLEALRKDPKMFLKEGVHPNSDSAYNYSKAVDDGNGGRYHSAIAKYLKIVRADATHLWARNNLAWKLATCPELQIRDGHGSVRYAIEVCEASDWQYWGFLDTLGCALAEAGQFEKAIECLELAEKLAVGSHKDDFETGREDWQLNLERARMKNRPVETAKDVKRVDGE